MKNRRLIFCGASEFALPALKALAMVDYPLMVISIPPKAMGRRLKVQENVVAQAAKELNLPLFCPEDVNSEESLQEIRSFEPDIIITASFGAFLGKRLRELCLCINLHPSLLPLLRGATPIQSSLLQGFDRTGVSIFEMVKKMDAGSIRMQKELLILDEDNYSSLHEKLSELAASILLDFLDNPASYPAIEQNDTSATYCSKIDTSDLEIDWNQDAQTIRNQVRAFPPIPVHALSDRVRCSRSSLPASLTKLSTQSRALCTALSKTPALSLIVALALYSSTKCKPRGRSRCPPTATSWVRGLSPMNYLEVNL